MYRMALLLLLTMVTFAVHAETLNIGHLETADDTGIHWQYWTCNRTGPTLHCDLVQTFINHEVDPLERDATIQNKGAQMTPDLFRRSMSEACTNIEEIRKAAYTTLATGKKPDGSAIGKQQAIDVRATVDLMGAACKNPTPDTIKATIAHEVDQSTRTCVVTNISSDDTLHWNEVLKEWESRSPETGPCGSVTETRLHQDPTSKLGFWLMEERHVFTRPSGTLPNGRSCSILPADKTYHFTWRANTNDVDCTYIRNTMN